MPERACGAPADWQAALQGGDRLLIDATDRAYRRSQEDATQRAHDSGQHSGRG
jgi:hypothetical protein